MPKYFFLFLLLISVFSQAEIEISNELFLSGSYHHLLDSSLNPDNRVLEIPYQSFAFELRPQLLARVSDRTKLIFRFRFIGQNFDSQFQTPDETRRSSKGVSDITDAFIETVVTDDLLFSAGLQNYQWGPAELVSPSNPFFHFSSQQKSFFYKEKGHGLVRLNKSFISNWNIVAMSEVIDNRDQKWQESEKFVPKHLVKAEVQLASKSQYLSVLAGQGEGQRPFIGEYFNIEVVEGLSLYTDARWSQGHNEYRPVTSEFGYNEMVKAAHASTDLHTLALGGLRYESDKFDIRQEFIYNSLGYSSAEWSQALQAIRIPSPAVFDNFKRLARPGLEFYRTYYSYTSLRIPDFCNWRDSQIYARYLANLDDGSGVLQMSFDKILNDSIVLYGESLIFMGAMDTEFRLGDDFQLSLGFKKSF